MFSLKIKTNSLNKQTISVTRARARTQKLDKLNTIQHTAFIWYRRPVDERKKTTFINEKSAVEHISYELNP